MIELKSYTRAELAAALNTNENRQQIIRKLENLGIEYSVSGRGKTLTFEIKKFKDEFKVFCILELGFDIRTDFDSLAYFLYRFFNDEDFQIQPYSEMEIRALEDEFHICRQTLSKWKRKLKAKNLFNESDEYEYYSVSNGNRRKIKRDEYSKAWIAFYEYRDAHKKEVGFDYKNAYSFMKARIGGMPIKRAKLNNNAFYLGIIDKITELSINYFENRV